MSFGPYLPYPPDRYHGEIGETSGWLRPTDSPHDIVSPTGSADYLATGAATNGDFGLYRWNMAEEPSGPGQPLPPQHLRIVLRHLGDGSALRRRRVARRPTRRLLLRAPRRVARLPQRVRGAGVDAHPLRPRRAQGGLLRRSGRVGQHRDGNRPTRRWLSSTSATTPSGSEPSSDFLAWCLRRVPTGLPGGWFTHRISRYP